MIDLELGGTQQTTPHKLEIYIRSSVSDCNPQSYAYRCDLYQPCK